MSNEICNYHIRDGYPCGRDTTPSEIADYYGEAPSNLPRWINIKDRLPQQNERVLVWLLEKGKIDIDVIRREGKSDGGELQFIKNYLHNITFWMQLPTPPNTGEDR